MRTKRCLWLAALAVLSCLVFAQPGHADECSAFNDAFANNAAKHQQDLLDYATKVSSQFPITPAGNTCTDQIMNLMKTLPSIADPMGVASTAISGILSSVMGQVCSSVMSSITSASSALTSFAKVCVPIPKFNMSTESSAFSGSTSTCSGGSSNSLLSSSLSSTSSSTFLDFLK